MLDLLSGAFACIVVVFIIFATLMGADMAGARAFLYIEARVSIEPSQSNADLSLLPEIAVRLDPVHDDYPGTVYRFDEDGTYPLGLRLKTSRETRSEAVDYHRQGIAPWPHLRGQEIDEAGLPTGSRSHPILGNRARGEYVVSLLLVGSRVAQDASIEGGNDSVLDTVVRVELICTMSEVGGGTLQVPFQVKRDLSLRELLDEERDKPSVSARMAYDFLDGRDSDAPGEVVNIEPAGLPVLLQLGVRVGDG